jgi:hypothetical protein
MLKPDAMQLEALTLQYAAHELYMPGKLTVNRHRMLTKPDVTKP